MNFRLRVWLARLSGQLWFRPALWSGIATVATLLATLANAYVPHTRVPEIDQGTLQNLLTIMASSMLTIATFSLSVLVGAFSSASMAATPRAISLMMADDTAQSAIASFIAAFIYSIISLIALGLDYYGTSGRFVLLACTLLVMAWVVISLLRWIQTLASLGGMGDTIIRVERVATESLCCHRRLPFLGARPAPAEVHGWPVHGSDSGYLQRIDLASLQALASEQDTLCHIQVRPGAFVHPAQPLVILACEPRDAALREAIATAFLVGPERTFEQDPRFGLIVLGEIGLRAMSAAINDSGTAIAVLAAQARVFVRSAREAPEKIPVYDRVTLVPLAESSLVRGAFDAIARDGAGLFEIGIRLQKTLAVVAANGSAETAAAVRQSARRAYDRAASALSLNYERKALAELLTEIPG